MQGVLTNSPLGYILQDLTGGKRVLRLGNLGGSARAFVLALLYASLGRHLLVIVPDEKKEQGLSQDLAFFLNSAPTSTQPPRKDFFLFPQADSSKGQDLRRLSQRIEVLDRLLSGPPAVIWAPLTSLLHQVYPREELLARRNCLYQGEPCTREHLIELALKYGYQRVELVEEQGDFSVRGGIVDIFPPAQPYPIRIELRENLIDSLREFDPESQKSIRHIQQAKILPVKDFDGLRGGDYLFDYLPPEALMVVIEPELLEDRWEGLAKEGSAEDHDLTGEEFHLYLEEYQRLEISGLDLGEGGDSYNLTSSSVGYYRNRFSDLAAQLKQWQKENYHIFLVCLNRGQAVRLKGLVEAYGLGAELSSPRSIPSLLEDYPASSPRDTVRPINILIGHLAAGFNLPELRVAFLVEEEIFGIRKKRYLPQTIKKELSLSSFSTLKVNDYVVHIDYGIGQYLGITKLETGGVVREFLELEYADGDKLYVPVERLNLIQRYLGAGQASPRLDKLGHHAWKRLKRKVKEDLKRLAHDLLNLYAARKVSEGFAFSPDNHLHQEFDSLFEYEETPHQLQAIMDVKADMEKPEPMDRLVCGDVGYGKTEVAMRAAFKAVMDNKQVAVLVPTTILAQQHLQTFQRRFANYPVTIEMLSRFKSRQEQKKIIQDIKNGLVDIVIGTHRLLQKDVQFKDLGLLIIDEEQRFGVMHKERLKQLKKNVDVLTLTATPIPRTLYLSLAGIRDISVIETPPEDRLPIQTFIRRFSPGIIKEAIERELARNGQVFFVHNRIESIEAIKRFLQRLVPQARIEIAHGQMPERELEKVMMRFLNREFDILLSTSIIESGLDIPSVNTIIINRADQFGLADLYQLRGRVGRDRYQAYAYLLVPEESHLSEEARQRLQAIRELSELGSGFQLASRDMEIRGAGNILGPEQSGHVSAVGFELYCRLLAEAIRELKGEGETEQLPEPEINLPLQGYIPEDYIGQPGQRLDIYKRLSEVTRQEELDLYREEIEDRYGPLPPPFVQLFVFLEIKLLARRLRLERIEKKGDKIILTFNSRAITIPHKKMVLSQEEEVPLDWIDEHCVVLRQNPAHELPDFIKTILQAMDGYVIVRAQKEGD